MTKRNCRAGFRDADRPRLSSHPRADGFEAPSDLPANQQTNRSGHPRFFSSRHGRRRGFRRAPCVEPRCRGGSEQRLCRADQVGAICSPKACADSFPSRTRAKNCSNKCVPRSIRRGIRPARGNARLGERNGERAPPGESSAGGIDLALSASLPWPASTHFSS